MNDVVSVKMKKYKLALDMRDSVRDMSIAVRNLGLLTDPKEMAPEWERVQTQKKLFIKNREELARMMEIDSVPAGRAAFQKILEAEGPALTSFEKGGAARVAEPAGGNHRLPDERLPPGPARAAKCA